MIGFCDSPQAFRLNFGSSRIRRLDQRSSFQAAVLFFASWAFRILGVAPIPLAFRLCRSFYATFVTLDLWILLFVSYTVIMLSFTLITVYQFWYFVFILSFALIVVFIFLFPFVFRSYTLNYSIQNQNVKPNLAIWATNSSIQ